MSRTNETRHIKRRKTCKCKCRLDTSDYEHKQRWNNDKCKCKSKELITEVVIKDFFEILVTVSVNVLIYVILESTQITNIENAEKD